MEVNPSRRTGKIQLICPDLSHISKIYQNSIPKKNLQSLKVDQRPQILVILNFRESCDSKLSYLHTFHITTIFIKLRGHPKSRYAGRGRGSHDESVWVHTRGRAFKPGE